MSMKVTFRLDVPNIKLLRKQGYGDTIDHVIRPVMTRGVLLWSREASLRTPVDTGHARGSIFTSILGTLTGTRGVLRGVTGMRAKYSIYLEKGSRPHWPPVDKLRGWARRNLGDERLAFVVARAISRRGTKAHKMFELGLVKVRPIIQADMQAALKEISRRLLR